jgi:hypothetical protein
LKKRCGEPGKMLILFRVHKCDSDGLIVGSSNHWIKERENPPVSLVPCTKRGAAEAHCGVRSSLCHAEVLGDSITQAFIISTCFHIPIVAPAGMDLQADSKGAFYRAVFPAMFFAIPAAIGTSTRLPW